MKINLAYSRSSVFHIPNAPSPYRYFNGFLETHKGYQEAFVSFCIKFWVCISRKCMVLLRVRRWAIPSLAFYRLHHVWPPEV